MEKQDFGWLGGKLRDAFEWLVSKFELLALWIVDKLLDLVFAFVDLIMQGLDWFYALLQNVLPESLSQNFSALSPMFGVVRAWFPVEYLASLIAVLVAVQTVVVGFKFVLKVKQLFNPLG